MIVALMPVRNEAWCLGFTLRAALMWADMVVLLNHASTDWSGGVIADVIHEYPSRLVLLQETDPVWEEMRHRQRMLDWARKMGATHIAMVDADEALTGPITVVHELIESLHGRVLLQFPWICLDTLDTYYSSGIWSQQYASFAFKDHPAAHWVARKGYDFHHREPMGVYWRMFHVKHHLEGGLLHLQFLNKRRLKAKQYLYQLTERLRWPDREPVEVVRDRYSQTVEAALAAESKPCPATWWAPYAHLMQYLDVDESKTPWQEFECRQILSKHPGIGAGLNDFGLFAYNLLCDSEK